MIGFYVVAKGSMMRDGQVVIERDQDYEVFNIDRMINAESPMFLIYSKQGKFEYIDSCHFKPDYEDENDDDDLGGGVIYNAGDSCCCGYAERFH